MWGCNPGDVRSVNSPACDCFLRDLLYDRLHWYVDTFIFQAGSRKFVDPTWNDVVEPGKICCHIESKAVHGSPTTESNTNGGYLSGIPAFGVHPYTRVSAYTKAIVES